MFLKKRLLPVVFLFVCLWETSTFAEDFSILPLTGRVFGDVYVPTQDPIPQLPLEQLSGSLWLESNPHLGEHSYAKIIGEFDAFDGQYSYSSDLSTASHLEAVLREAYVGSSKEGLEIRAGKMILPWGKSDVFNPTDYHTAKNLSFFNPDDEVRRIGGSSLEILYTPNEGSSSWNNIVVFTPIFAQGRQLFPPNLIPFGVTLADPNTPSITFLDSEIGDKISYTGAGWDASLSFFNGWSHQPQLQEISHSLVGPIVLLNMGQVFRRVISYGGDASISHDKWVFRGESAYTVTPNDSGSNALELPTHWDSVVGAERPLGDKFRVQAQIILRIFPRYTSPSSQTGSDPISTTINQQIAAENALLNSYQDPSRPGGTLRVSYTDDKTGWDGEIFVLQNFAGGDFLVRPRVSYAWTDLIKSTVGLDLYGGPTNRPLGALAPDSAVFAETKYSF